MIEDAIINELQLGINSEMEQVSSEDEDLKIDKNQCLNTLKKIKQGDLSGFSEIDDVKTYIQDLKYEIS